MECIDNNDPSPMDCKENRSNNATPTSNSSAKPDFKVVDREESDDSSDENGSDDESMSDNGLSDYGELAIHTTIFSFVSKLLTVTTLNHQQLKQNAYAYETSAETKPA